MTAIRQRSERVELSKSDYSAVENYVLSNYKKLIGKKTIISIEKYNLLSPNNSETTNCNSFYSIKTNITESPLILGGDILN